MALANTAPSDQSRTQSLLVKKLGLLFKNMLLPTTLPHHILYIVFVTSIPLSVFH